MKAARLFAWVPLGIVVLGIGSARAARATEVPAPAPVQVFAQAGTGIVELGHVEAGAFLGRHFTVEGMAAWAGVFGGRYGGAVLYALGHAQDQRPPKKAILFGARVMLASDGRFDSHGDDLSSYVAIPVGYGYLSDSGFYFRAMVSAAITRSRTTSNDPATPSLPTVSHHLGIGGPLVTVAFGFAI